MDVAYATVVRDHHSHDLVKHLEAKKFDLAEKTMKDIEMIFGKIRDEITSGKAKAEHHEEITPDILELMKQQINDTARTGREHGFSLCGNKPEIAQPGTHNNIGLKKCPGLTMLFHTHPCNTPHPSDMDFKAAEKVEGLHKTCIGTQDGIHCYDPLSKQRIESIPV